MNAEHFDKTYGEINNRTKFNWFEALAKGPSITTTEWRELEFKAGLWTTCACGNQCAIIPRHHDSEHHQNGEPVDKILAELGGNMGFYGAIKEQNYRKALLFLRQIEARSEYLIHEELSKTLNTYKSYNQDLVALKETFEKDVEQLRKKFEEDTEILKSKRDTAQSILIKNNML